MAVVQLFVLAVMVSAVLIVFTELYSSYCSVSWLHTMVMLWELVDISALIDDFRRNQRRRARDWHGGLVANRRNWAAVVLQCKRAENWS